MGVLVLVISHDRLRRSLMKRMEVLSFRCMPDGTTVHTHTTRPKAIHYDIILVTSLESIEPDQATCNVTLKDLPCHATHLPGTLS